MAVEEELIRILKKMKVFSSVNFIILFGSAVSGKSKPMSDIDIAISAELPQKERFTIRTKLLGMFPEKYDIQIFEDLPLRVKIQVLKGKLIYCKDREKLTELAIELKKEHEDFLPRFNYYITGMKNVQRESI